MSSEKDFDSEENGEGSGEGIKENISKYKIPAILIVVFVLAAIATSTVNNSISGAAIADLRSEYEQKINDLETGTNQNNNLLLENRNLQDEVNLYGGIITGLDKEIVETQSSIYNFDITWDKYVTVEPKKDYIFSVDIRNNAGAERTYSVGVEFKSNKDNVFDSKPTAGSLILMPGNSGTLNMRFSPQRSGYAIFELFVNENYVGDVVIFSI